MILESESIGYGVLPMDKKNTSGIANLGSISPIAPILAVLDFALLGSISIILSGIFATIKENEDYLIYPRLIIESSIAWLIVISLGGVDSLEWIQISAVFTVAFCSSRLSLIEELNYLKMQHFLIAASITQLVFISLFDGWEIEPSIILFLLFVYLIRMEITNLEISTYWGIFIGLKGCEIALSGGVLGSPTINYDPAYDTWIMMIGGPVLGVAVYETIASYFTSNKNDE